VTGLGKLMLNTVVTFPDSSPVSIPDLLIFNLVLNLILDEILQGKQHPKNILKLPLKWLFSALLFFKA